MSNYKTWSIRRRHEWLAKPGKKQRVKRRSARRVGLLDAWERNGVGAKPAAEAPAAEAAAEAPKA
jgi:hypothetical protein